MVFFTSDIHLGHSNIISLCNRPFVNIEEMEQYPSFVDFERKARVGCRAFVASCCNGDALCR